MLHKLKEYSQAFRNIPGAFRLVWEADSRDTLIMSGLTLVGALIPLGQAWVAKLIIDCVVHALNAHLEAREGLRLAIPYLAIQFVLLVLGSVVTQMRTLSEELLDHRLGHLINTRIIRKALALELHYFEDADFYDKMQNARRQSEFRALAIIDNGFLLLQNWITLVSFLFVLLAFNPLVALLLFGTTLPSFLVQNRYGRLNFRLQSWKTPESRKMQYFEHLLTVDTSAKEIKLFNLGEPLLKRYNDIFWGIFKEDARLAWSRSWVSLAWGVLSTLSFYGAYGWIVYVTIAGRISLGDMTLYLTLFRQSQGTFQGMFDNISRLYENGLFMDNLFGFLALPSQESRQGAVTPKAEPGSIEFRGVSFRYPGGDSKTHPWVLRHFDLTIAPGEKLALVGENGAGKTTLIKLLTRLYDPTEGLILLNGIDIREYPLEDLRRRIGVIFQDFVKYQLSLRENVGFGSIDDVEDLARVKTAAARGGADQVAKDLPSGFDTVLGQWFKDGREISGGQWQKIALSRAFMREGEVLVLDEPTSSLDAEREYEIFQQFRKLTEGRTAILISHRFSTVRMADRIAVLKEGHLIEMGSHSELLARAGTYAKLFSMQAEGYR